MFPLCEPDSKDTLTQLGIGVQELNTKFGGKKKTFLVGMDTFRGEKQEEKTVSVIVGEVLLFTPTYSLLDQRCPT